MERPLDLIASSLEVGIPHVDVDQVQTGRDCRRAIARSDTRTDGAFKPLYCLRLTPETSQGRRARQNQLARPGVLLVLNQRQRPVDIRQSLLMSGASARQPRR